MNDKKEIKLRVPEAVQPGTFANNTLVSHQGLVNVQMFIDRLHGSSSAWRFDDLDSAGCVQGSRFCLFG